MRLQNVLLVVASSIVAIAILEIGLRAFGFSAPSFYVPDPYTGAKHRAGAEGWDRREGESYVRISSQGLRDVEHGPKRAGAFRIAVLGDSYAEGLAVELADTFWSVAADELASCPALAGRTIEPINFGVSGYGTAQEWAALHERGWAFDPDLIVLAFFTENDVRDNSRALSKEPLRPYFTLADGELVIDQSFLESAEYRAKQSRPSQLLFRMIDRVRLLQLANLAKNNLRKRYLLEQSGGGKLEPPANPVHHPIYSEPTDRRWRDAWAVTEALLVKIAGEVREHGKQFVLVSLSNPIQVHPDRELRRAFEEAYQVDDLFHAERRLDALATRTGFSYLALAPAMQAEVDASGRYFHGFERVNSKGEGHWNRDGHRFAGRTLAAFLCGVLQNEGAR